VSDVPSGTATLIRMVNQIARNVSHETPDVAAQQIAGHLNSFWAPSMRSQLLAYVASGGAGVDDLALSALTQVR
jgi:formate dehydrogenase subunit delta